MSKLIIFDVDGVLEQKDLLSKYRYEALDKALAEKFNLTEKQVKERVNKAKNNLPPEKKKTSAYVYAEAGLTRKEYFDILDSVDPKNYLEKDKECQEMLRKLSKNNRIVTFSNTSINASKKTLEALGIIKFISRIYSSEEFRESKPSTKILKKILSDQSFSAKDVFMIGDSVEKDIKPAHELGIKTILFSPKEKPGNLEGVDFVVKKMKEIVELV